MAKAFNRLRKQVQDRRSYDRAPNLTARVRRIEEHLFEMSALLVHSIATHGEGDEPDKQAQSFLEASEEFKKHLEEVLKEDKRG